MTHDTNRAPEMLVLCIIGATLTWAAIAMGVLG